jgi:hypothetical protein
MAEMKTLRFSAFDHARRHLSPRLPAGKGRCTSHPRGLLDDGAHPSHPRRMAPPFSLSRLERVGLHRHGSTVALAWRT